jgi:hypothetical protein
MKCFVFLCLIAAAQCGTIQRITRNTEAIIPTLVEEILKVELNQDLKKNSDVEEPIVSRTIEEEKEKVVIPDTIPVEIRADTMPEMVEKIEKIVEIVSVPEPVDSTRKEEESAAPVAEILKETIVMEPVVDAVRKEMEPMAAVVMTEEEMVKPMVRNVIKEEIPQVEELRVVPAEAVKETIPEPVIASHSVEPSPVIEEKVTIIDEVKSAQPVMPEIIPEAPKSDVVVEMIMVEKMTQPEMVKEEIKAVVEEELKKVEPEMMMGTDEIPAVKGVDGRQNIIQQGLQTVQNLVQNVPIVGPLLNRNSSPAPNEEASTSSSVPAQSDDAAANENSENVGEQQAAPSTTARPARPVIDAIQSAVANVQNVFTNAASNNNSPVGDEQQNPLQQFVSGLQNNVQSAITQVQHAVNNVFGAPASNNPTKTEESAQTPVEAVAAAAEEQPAPQEEVAVVEEEQAKSVEIKPILVDEPVQKKEENESAAQH